MTQLPFGGRGEGTGSRAATAPTALRVARIGAVAVGCLFAAGCARPWTPPEEWAPKPQAAAPFAIVALRVEDGSLAKQLAAAVHQAGMAHETPYVELTSRWCRGCHWLDHGLKDSALARAFGGTYVVRVDVDAWAGRLEGTGLDYHTGPLPAFIALSDAGRPVGEWADAGVWQSEVPREAAPVLASFFHEGR